MSMKSQGENTAFEEAPMAYYTQTKGLFLELDYRFNCMPYFEIGNPYADRLYAVSYTHLGALCAMTLATKDTKPWGIYLGYQCIRIKERSQKMLELDISELEAD